MSNAEKCEHAWDDEYVCRMCSCVKTGSPPWWLWLLRGLPSGPRAVLLALWTFADRNTTTPRPVYPRNKTISDRCNGLSHGTIRAHLATLKTLGWIRTVDATGRTLQLAWAKPYPLESRTLPAEKQAGALESKRAEKPAHPAEKQAGTRRNNSVQPLENQRHTYELPCDSTEELPGDARTHELESDDHAIRPSPPPATTGPSSRPTHAKPPRDMPDRRPIGDANPHLAERSRAHQARLDREAELDAEASKPRMGGLPKAVLAAIYAVGNGWHRELESRAIAGSEGETWCESLARARDVASVDRLTPEAITRVLVAWGKLSPRERDAFPRREIWWTKRWGWATKHVDQSAERIDYRSLPLPPKLPGEFR